MTKRCWRTAGIFSVFLLLVCLLCPSLQKPKPGLTEPFDFDNLEEMSDDDLHSKLKSGGFTQIKVDSYKECNKQKCPKMIGLCPQGGSCVVTGECVEGKGCGCEIKVNCNHKRKSKMKSDHISTKIKNRYKTSKHRACAKDAHSKDKCHEWATKACKLRNKDMFESKGNCSVTGEVACCYVLKSPKISKKEVIHSQSSDYGNQGKSERGSESSSTVAESEYKEESKKEVKHITKEEKQTQSEDEKRKLEEGPSGNEGVSVNTEKSISEMKASYNLTEAKSGDESKTRHTNRYRRKCRKMSEDKCDDAFARETCDYIIAENSCKENENGCRKKFKKTEEYCCVRYKCEAEDKLENGTKISEGESLELTNMTESNVICQDGKTSAKECKRETMAECKRNMGSLPCGEKQQKCRWKYKHGMCCKEHICKHEEQSLVKYLTKEESRSKLGSEAHETKFKENSFAEENITKGSESGGEGHKVEHVETKGTENKIEEVTIAGDDSELVEESRSGGEELVESGSEGNENKIKESKSSNETKTVETIRSENALVEEENISKGSRSGAKEVKVEKVDSDDYENEIEENISAGDEYKSEIDALNEEETEYEGEDEGYGEGEDEGYGKGEDYEENKSGEEDQLIRYIYEGIAMNQHYQSDHCSKDKICESLKLKGVCKTGQLICKAEQNCDDGSKKHCTCRISTQCKGGDNENGDGNYTSEENNDYENYEPGEAILSEELNATKEDKFGKNINGENGQTNYTETEGQQNKSTIQLRTSESNQDSLHFYSPSNQEVIKTETKISSKITKTAGESESKASESRSGMKTKEVMNKEQGRKDGVQESGSTTYTQNTTLDKGSSYLEKAILYMNIPATVHYANTELTKTKCSAMARKIDIGCNKERNFQVYLFCMKSYCHCFIKYDFCHKGHEAEKVLESGSVSVSTSTKNTHPEAPNIQPEGSGTGNEDSIKSEAGSEGSRSVNEESGGAKAESSTTELKTEAGSERTELVTEVKSAVTELVAESKSAGSKSAAKAEKQGATDYEVQKFIDDYEDGDDTYSDEDNDYTKKQGDDYGYDDEEEDEDDDEEEENDSNDKGAENYDNNKGAEDYDNNTGAEDYDNDAGAGDYEYGDDDYDSQEEEDAMTEHDLTGKQRTTFYQSHIFQANVLEELKGGGSTHVDVEQSECTVPNQCPQIGFLCETVNGSCNANFKNGKCLLTVQCG